MYVFITFHHLSSSYMFSPSGVLIWYNLCPEMGWILWYHLEKVALWLETHWCRNPVVRDPVVGDPVDEVIGSQPFYKGSNGCPCPACLKHILFSASLPFQALAQVSIARLLPPHQPQQTKHSFLNNIFLKLVHLTPLAAAWLQKHAR